MLLTNGDKLGPYEILAPLGAGGMGEVYRAKDTKLDREVAIKVLPAALAQDPDRLARFEREAKVLASLNHPNIAQIHGIEDHALIMELVPGETLKGPLPLATALNYTKQIAEALEAAHDGGIIHRDLKPGNIMVTPAGVVKVLDFGLAAVARSADASGPDPSKTLTMRETKAGFIMGTAAYMSPEQASGKPVDKRADIWSFGVVLWEMLTGRRLFDGETISHTLASVLKDPIELDVVKAPPQIRELLARCLDRNPKDRLRDIGEARVAIESYLKDPAGAAPENTATSGTSRWWIALASATAIIAAVAGIGWFRATRPTEKPLIRFEVDLGTDLTPISRAAISPDGTRIAFVGSDASGKRYLLTRRLDQPKASVLDEGAISVPFSSRPTTNGSAIGHPKNCKRSLRKVASRLR
jgi:serine/threonine protein kinase